MHTHYYRYCSAILSHSEIENATPAMQQTEQSTLLFITEQFLLSACIRHHFHNSHPEVSLSPSMFSDSKHQLIFSTLLQREFNRGSNDISLLENLLNANQQLDIAGGRAYLDEILNYVAEQDTLLEYYQIIRDVYYRKKLKEIAASLSNFADDYTISISSAKSLSIKMLEMLDAEPISNSTKKVDTFLHDFLLTDSRINNSKIIFSGIKELDEVSGGFIPGEITVLAGRPGMGKTTFALSLLHHICASEKKTVGYVSLSNKAKQLISNLLTQLNGIITSKQNQVEQDYEDVDIAAQAIQQLSAYPLYLDDGTRNNIKSLLRSCWNLKRKHKADLIVIDYLQLLDNPSKIMSRERALGYACQQLKIMARKMGVPLILVSQVSRAPEHRSGDKVPELRDLRESGAIEEVADKVLFVHRPAYYQNRNQTSNSTLQKAELIIAKNKTGPNGSIQLQFDKKHLLFAERNQQEAFDKPKVITKQKKLTSILEEDFRKKFAEIFNTEN